MLLTLAGLDVYSDSNARQRSDACMADSTVGCQAQFATTSELAMPRYQVQHSLVIVDGPL